MIKICIKSILFSIILSLTVLPFRSISQEITVTIDPLERFQRFEGWGTSLCWWAVLAGKWDDANRKALVNAIVDPDTGLGYNIFRYNIGGGDQPGHDHLTKGSGGAKVPGFKPTESGDYDWDADSYQRRILLEINEHGQDLIFEAFSNSPPWWMTKSGCVSGNSDGSDNLKEDYFDDFADYLSEVVKYYKDTWNITFRTVEPFNEPSAGWWKSMGDQEGCGFKNNQSKMIKELGKALVAKNLFGATSVSAADESSIDQALTSLNGYDTEALEYLSQVNTHSYSGHNSRTQLASKASSLGKRVWQSESGPLHKNDNSHIALWMADVIIRDIRDLKAEAWIDWQVSDPAENWMSINADHRNQKFTYKSRFYMHCAFSRFIRPGSHIISSDNDNTIAALTKDSSLVVVIRNGTGNDKMYSLDLSKFSHTGKTVKVYQFSLPGDLKPLADMQLPDNNRLSINSPSQTVTTCVFSNVSSPPCTPSEITSYVKINSQPWQETTNVTLNAGDTLKFGPQPLSNGYWSWKGPQDFKSENREITIRNISKSQEGDYVAAFCNSQGCTSSVVINVTVYDPSKIINKENSRNKYDNRIYFRGNNLTVISDYQYPLTIQVFTLKGVSVYKKTIFKNVTTPVFSGIPYGNFIVRISTESGKPVFEKMLVNLF
ncbi:MAG: glycosyl hydrolase [Fibrobacter sp.]|nr:glycosyl hydrolase [Fibrobacter sp.]